MINFAKMSFCFLVLLLTSRARITASDLSVQNIVVTDTGSQYVGDYPRNAINITLNISSLTNISAALEQCADANRPFLFVQNTTLLGCGELLWVNRSNQTFDGNMNISSTTSLLRDLKNSTTILSHNGTVSITATIQPSTVMVNMTNTFEPLSSTQSKIDGTDILSPNGTATIAPSNVMMHMTSNIASLIGNKSDGIYDGSQISPPNSTVTISPSGVVVDVTSHVVPLHGNESENISDGPRLSSENAAWLTKPVSQSKTMPYMTTSVVAVNNTFFTGSLNRSHIVISPLNTTILPSKVMVNMTRTLAASNGTSSVNGTEIILTTASFSGTSAVITSSGMVYNLNSSMHPSPSSINSTDSLVSSSLTARCSNSTCQTSNLDNATELTKAYKSELFGEVSIAVFTLTNYTISLPTTRNLSMNCSFIPGDGTPVVSMKTDESMVTFSHRYFLPGRYRASVTCIRNLTVLVFVSRRVFVSLPLKYSGVNCPGRFQTNKTYFCVFNVDQASELDVEVKVGNDLEGSHRFTETTLSVVSAENETNKDLNRVTLEFYSPLLVFTSPFYVRCVELVSNISGTFNLKVFRPINQKSDVYTEARGNISCQTPPANKSSLNASICFQTFISPLRNTSDYLATNESTAVHNITITVASGYNFLTLHDDEVFKAQPGDVIATSTPVFLTQMNATSNESYIIENFSLYGFVPYEARILLRFIDPRVLRLGINVRKFEGYVTNFEQFITIQRPVAGLVLNYEDIVKVNTSGTLGFELSRGTNASCDWLLSRRTNASCDWLLTGDKVDFQGSVNTSARRNRSSTNEFEGLETSFQHAHDIPGTFIFNVNCSNKVSTLSENVTISVRRNVSDLSASLCFASFAYTRAQTCFDSEASGDHVGYKWTIESKYYHTSKVDVVFQESTLPGNKTLVTVTTWNVVSREGPFPLRIDVLENPLDIQISPNLTVASQSYVNITAIVQWSPYANASALYTDYGINISQSLQSFIDFPVFRVKIDKKLIAENISNGTLLTHKFENVGSTSISYDVYVEATGHPEMNRKVELLVVDKIEKLTITSTCLSEIFIHEKCSFTAQYDGSDVTCNWLIGKNEVFNKDEISHDFHILGEITIILDARNRVSRKKAVYNLSVVPAQVISESSSLEPGYQISSSGKVLPTPSIASSVSFTSFTGESLAGQVLSSSIKPSSSMDLTNTLGVIPSTVILSSELSRETISVILGLSRTLKSTVLAQSDSLSTEVNASTTEFGPSSHIDPVTKVLKIKGPRVAAVGKMVTFYALNTGSSTSLSWLINNTLLVSMNNSISYKFNYPGEFKVFVNGSITNSRQNASFTVHIQESISGFQSFVHQKPLSKRVDVLFSMSSGSDVSYSVDFGDGSETIVVGKVRELRENISVFYLYAKPGLYNLSISVFSMVGPNKTEYREVFINDTCEFKSAVLYGVSGDFKTRNKFTDNDEIVMAVQATLNCTEDLPLKYRWHVVRLNSSIPNGMPIKLAINNVPVFTFSANDINFSDYKVTVTVENTYDGSSLTRNGYFSKVLQSFDVHIACGDTRMASVDEPLSINATVIASPEEVMNLQYRWFCDDDLNVTCFGNDIQRNMSRIRFPGRFFDVGEVYDFVVRVSDGEREGVATQRITFGFSNMTVDLCLSSSQDNKPIFFSTQDTDIIPSCPRCSHILQPAWSWRVLKISSQSNSTIEIDVKNLVLNSSKLHIPANTLQPNTLYRIQVNATSLTQNISGYASYKIKTNDVPVGGYCQIPPYAGNTLLNAFQATCFAWYDKDQPLSYEYWYSTGGTKYNLFYKGESPVAELTFFEAGVREKDFVVSVKVVIRDSKGEPTTQFLKVKNLPPSDSQIEELFSSSLGIDNQVDNLLNVSGIQSAVQFLKIVSSLLNENSSIAENISKQIEIRETMLRNLKNLCCSTSVLIKQTVDIMLSVSNVPSELNLNAQLHASTIYLNITRSLSLLSTTTEVINIAEKVATGVSTLLSAVSFLSSSTRSRNITEIKKINEDSLLVIDKLGDVLLKHANPGEPAIMLTTSSFTIAVQTHRTTEFPGTRLNVLNEITEFIVPRKLKPIQGSFVSSKMISMSNNTVLLPVASSLLPTTNVASLVLINTEGNELRMNDLVEPFNIVLDHSDSHQSSAQRSSPSPTQLSTQSSIAHNSKLTEDSDPDLYEINTTTRNPSILVTIPHIFTDNKGQLRVRIRRANQSSATGSEFIVLSTSSFPVSLTWRGLSGSGTYYISIKYESLSFRLAGKANEIEYSVSFREIGCYYWNASFGEWMSNGCKVGLQSTTTRTHCQCNHLTWFGGRLIVPPNTISFTKISERIKDPSNYATILSVLCSLLVLYCVILVWARRRDIKDKVKNEITWCPSNQLSDSYHYQVIVYTGIRRNAGTTANVGLMLSGELGKSRKCLLKSSKRETLKRGHIDSFLITTDGRLGPLEYIHIWHDNAGSDPAWFLNRVVVFDSENGEVGNFLCYRWLAVDEGDGQIQRLLPLAEAEDLRRFRHLFVSRATSELTDAHLWFSVAFRPASSPFTRVQRVSCCLALLLTSMMANAMWYQTGDSGNSTQVNLGLFSFSWDEVFIGICSSLIVFPVNLLLVQIFRHCRSKNPTSLTRRPSFLPFQNGKVNPAFLNVHSSVLTLGSLHGSPDVACDVPSVLAPSQKSSEQHRKTSVLSYIVVSPQTSRNGSPSMTSLLRKNVDSPTQATGKDNLLPYWCQYIGWFGVLVTCLISATVTFLYAVEFGEEKTKKWLLSLTISLVNDVFIAQPSKVLIVTVILAYIFKRPLKERYVSDDVIQLEVPERAPEQTEVEAPDFDLCAADEFLRAAREKRAKDKFMYGLMKDVFSHLCFTVLVLIIAYGQRDVMGYYLTSTQENTFVYQNFREKSLKKQSYGFYQVANVKDFWTWSKAVLIPGLSNNEWYNYTTQWSTFTANFGGFLFGAARVRQKRLKKDICEVLPMFKDIIASCSGNYEWSNEDQTNYATTWRKQSGNNYCSDKNSGSLPPDQWCYSRLKSYITAPFVGRLETYSGGGYGQDLGQDFEVALNLTRELGEHKWIDEYTRAVFVEFSLYNPNVNLFSVVTFIFEISSSGDFNPGSSILSIRLYNYVGDFQIFVLICQLIFLGFLCAFTYSSVKGIFRERCRFFSKAWNFYEFLVVLISWLAVAIYFVAIVFRKRILQEFRADPTKFTSFRYSASWQMTLEYIIACLVFMTFLKFWRLFQFNRRMFLFPLTLSNTAYELLSYTVVFSIVLMAFSLLYHLVLQAYNPNFIGIIVTMETLLRVLLGKSDVLVKNHQFPVLERVFIFIYMCLMKFILLNIFVTILNDGFKRARAQNNTQRNAFEFIDYIKNTVQELLGIRRLNVAKKKSVSAKRRVRFKDDNSMHKVENSLEILDRKAERLLNLVNSRSFEETFNEDTVV